MSGLLKYSDKGGGFPDELGPVDIPAAGPETGVDPYDTGGRGGGPTVETGTDPFAGSVAGSIPGVSTGGGDPFAGSTAGSIPGLTTGAGPVGAGITGGPGGAGGFPFGIGGGSPYRAPGLADFLSRPRAPVRTAVPTIRRPPPVIGPPAAWTGAGPVTNQNPYWIAHLAQMMGRGRLGAQQ